MTHPDMDLRYIRLFTENNARFLEQFTSLRSANRCE